MTGSDGRLNVLLVLIDSLNRSTLAPFGGSGPATPNLDRFARRARRFEQHFVGSLPCLPARRELMAGRQDFMWRPWGPLEPWDDNLATIAKARGYRTWLVTDHLHYWEAAGNGYMQPFEATRLIRGNELDTWHPPVGPDVPVPDWVAAIERWRPGFGRRFYANMRDVAAEEDFPAPRVMSTAADVLADAAEATPFYVQIECFDPHEPFYAPEPYASRYWSDPTDGFTVWPPYQDKAIEAAFLQQASAAQLEYIVSQYWAKITMVDTWFGRVLDALTDRRLWDDTAVVVLTDHGHDLGTHGGYGKNFPHWDTHAHIPLLMWHPMAPEPGAISDLTTMTDVHQSLIDLLGAARGGPDGVSLVPTLLGDARSRPRDAVLYGTFGQGVCCTDGEWTYMKGPEPDGELFMHSSLLFDSLLADADHSRAEPGRFIPGVEAPQWRVPASVVSTGTGAWLFQRSEDPDQLVNLWDDRPDQRRRMEDLTRRLLLDAGTPPVELRRLGLSDVDETRSRGGVEA